MFVIGTVAAMGGYTAVIGAGCEYDVADNCRVALSNVSMLGRWKIRAHMYDIHAVDRLCQAPADIGFFCAGATSKALQQRNPWLTTNLSVLASCAAIVIGAIVLFSL